jgi:hypothetical protein
VRSICVWRQARPGTASACADRDTDEHADVHTDAHTDADSHRNLDVQMDSNRNPDGQARRHDAVDSRAQPDSHTNASAYPDPNSEPDMHATTRPDRHVVFVRRYCFHSYAIGHIGLRDGFESLRNADGLLQRESVDNTLRPFRWELLQ